MKFPGLRRRYKRVEVGECTFSRSCRRGRRTGRPWGISFATIWELNYHNNTNQLPFVQFVHEELILWVGVVFEISIVDYETVLVEGDFADVAVFCFFLFLKLFWCSGYLDNIYLVFFSAFCIRLWTSGLRIAIPLFYPPAYDSVCCLPLFLSLSSYINRISTFFHVPQCFEIHLSDLKNI